MKNKTAAVLCILWLLVMVGIAASSATLLLSGKTGGAGLLLGAKDREILARYEKLDRIRIKYGC